MSIEAVKILRSRLGLPLNTAMHLLKTHGTVEAAERAFHAERIATICAEVNCDDTLAERYYQRFNGDMERAIHKLLQRPNIITTGRPTGIENIAGFNLEAERADGSKYPSKKREDMSIKLGDFDLLIEAFQSVFPYDGDTSFSFTGSHWFDNVTATQIMNEIKKINSDDPIIQDFYLEVTDWLESKLIYADCIAIHGSL